MTTAAHQLTPRRLGAEHESAHLLAARFFGLAVERVQVRDDGSGLTVLASRPTASDHDFASELYATAVVAAAGLAYSSWRGVPPESGADDLAKVDHCRAMFAEAAGRPMPDPLVGARKLLEGGFIFGDHFDLIAGALETRGVLTGADIDALTQPPAPVLEYGKVRRLTAAEQAWWPDDLRPAAILYGLCSPAG